VKSAGRRLLQRDFAQGLGRGNRGLFRCFDEFEKWGENNPDAAEERRDMSQPESGPGEGASKGVAYNVKRRSVAVVRNLDRKPVVGSVELDAMDEAKDAPKLRHRKSQVEKMFSTLAIKDLQVSLPKESLKSQI